jgi:23S rRNA (uracil1939-C5)-methyltransferase
VALAVGARVTLEAERPVAGGRMLARHRGQVVLVAGAIAGETVEALVTRVARGTVYADTTRVVTASPDRRPGVEGRCGGATFGHIQYGRQVALKAAIIEDAWRRIARLPVQAPAVIPSPERGYRSRARLHAREGRLGFFREGTHQLCDPASPGQLADATVAWVREMEGALRAGNHRSVAALDVVENVPATERACHLHVHGGAVPRELESLAGGLTGLSAAPSTDADEDDALDVLADRAVVVLAGEPSVVDRVPVSSEQGSAAVPLRHSASSFFQGNRFLLATLVGLVTRAAHDGPVLDLFAGTGLFGLALAATGRRTVTLVEGHPASGRDLAHNADLYGAHAVVRRESVESFVASPRPGLATWIVDPPRTGLSDRVRAAALRDRPGRIVYVSCDPATLARDVRSLVGGGYEVTSLVGLDLFPSTAHVEAVCVLDVNR